MSSTPNLKRSYHKMDLDTKPRFGRASSFKHSLTTTPTRDDKDDDGPEKGGHSLRKRARVNYATEQIEDEVTVPNSTSSVARAKKRKVSIFDDIEPVYGPRPKRRGLSVGADTPNSRRRNPSRKSTEIAAYREHAFDDLEDHDDDHDDDIQDTIEVGLSQSDITDDESTLEPQDAATDTVTATVEAHDAYEAQESKETLEMPNVDETQKSLTLSLHQPATTPPKSDSDALHIDAQPQVNKPEHVNKDTAIKDPSPLDEAPPQPQESPTTKVEKTSEDHITDPTQQLHDESAHSLTLTSESTAQAIESTTETTSEIVAPDTTLVTESVSKGETKGESRQASPSSPSHTHKTLEPTTETTNFVNAGQDIVAAGPSGQVDTPQTTPKKKLVAPEEAQEAQETQAIANGIPKSPSPPQLPETAAQPENIVGDKEVAVPSPASSPVPVIDAPTEQLIEPQPNTSAAGDTPITTTQPDSQEVSVNMIVITKADPPGRWANLTPYINGESTTYPLKFSLDEEDTTSENQSQEDKDASQDVSDVVAATNDKEDTPAAAASYDHTPAQDTSPRASPTQEVPDLVVSNSPAAAGEEPEEAEGSVSQEPESSASQKPVEKTKSYNYRKLNDAEAFISAFENYATMSTDDLYNLLAVSNKSLVQWEKEYLSMGKILDDEENSIRRLGQDQKYEFRTRDLNQHGANWEEIEFVTKGYKAKEKEGMTETRYLQQQDRLMASTYGFEHDPHPSKIGRQNPENQQAGVTTRGRSLRNQPRQTAKATEADVTILGKRQRKPIQLLDYSQAEGSRASTPVPLPATKGRRRKNAYADDDESVAGPSTSVQDDANSDAEPTTASGRRKRATRGKAAAPPRIVEERASTPTPTPQPAQASSSQEEGTKSSTRRGRPKAAATKAEDVDTVRPSIENESQPRARPTKILTLKVPPNILSLSGPSSAVTDNGDSRPSTANSDSTAHTVESSYSFRPNRQKRFRDEPTEDQTPSEEPPKKKKRATKKQTSPDELAQGSTPQPASRASQSRTETGKATKGKGRQKDTGSRNGTPMSQPTTDGGDEQLKDYSTMTKSEKMSASMRSTFQLTFYRSSCSVANIFL